MLCVSSFVSQIGSFIVCGGPFYESCFVTTMRRRNATPKCTSKGLSKRKDFDKHSSSDHESGPSSKSINIVLRVAPERREHASNMKQEETVENNIEAEKAATSHLCRHQICMMLVVDEGSQK